MAPQLLTRVEVGELLKLRPNSIAARESRGRPLLPKIKIGGATRYRLTDVQDLIDRSEIGAPETE